MPTKRKGGAQGAGARRLLVTRAGRIIKRILDDSDIGLTDFAKRAGVQRVTLHRVLTGERWKFITVDFAMSCCSAAGSRLQVSDFASITALPPGEEGDDEGPMRRKAKREAA